jgi:hypothetical protein
VTVGAPGQAARSVDITDPADVAAILTAVGPGQRPGAPFADACAPEARLKLVDEARKTTALLTFCKADLGPRARLDAADFPGKTVLVANVEALRAALRKAGALK